MKDPKGIMKDPEGIMKDPEGILKDPEGVLKDPRVFWGRSNQPIDYWDRDLIVRWAVPDLLLWLPSYRLYYG